VADIYHCPACGTQLDDDWWCPDCSRHITVAEMQAGPLDDPPEEDYSDD
jgi:uncharacterized Zn finger protein (UPF0148 family)